MTCYYPLQAWRARYLNENGRRPIVFKPHLSNGIRCDVPCGQCIGCKLEYSRQWAMRCHHEALCWETNSFITLTYSPEHLPSDQSLIKYHWQTFIKRLREQFVPLNPHPKPENPYDRLLEPELYYKISKENKQTPYGIFRRDNAIRFFMCGEYGEECQTCHKNKYECDRDLSHVFISSIGRPHYHACLFNFDLPDKTFWKTDGETHLYTSQILEKLWKHGFCSIGDVTFESAAYVARYITKKITGENAEEHYLKPNLETGEINNLLPEFTLQSRDPGIAKTWYDKYGHTDLEGDYVTINGRSMKPAKYYDMQLRETNEEEYDDIKLKRKKAALINPEENTIARLTVREKCKLITINKKLNRGLENGQ